MDIEAPLALLGGLSPATFMRRHWQKKPLLVRAAWPGVRAPLTRPELFTLAAREEVESRLVIREALGTAGPHRSARAASWRVRHGPLPRRALPPVSRPGWTLLVQGLDLHVPAAHDLLAPFRFVPAARLDDLMLSWASARGGVGPHLDSYDVFLLQVAGRRRWRIARARSAAQRACLPGQPLRVLQHFEPTQEWVLEPGDLLYLPPGWAHDGIAEGGECMTASVGFRAPAAAELARELLARMGEDAAADERLYADPAQPATQRAGAVPAPLVEFARGAAMAAVVEPGALERALGEWLTEPKPTVFFRPGPLRYRGRGLRLAAGTRMLYDARHVFINGEAFLASGRDAAALRRLADERHLEAGALARCSAGARGLVDEWRRSGWLYEERR